MRVSEKGFHFRARGTCGTFQKFRMVNPGLQTSALTILSPDPKRFINT